MLYPARYVVCCEGMLDEIFFLVVSCLELYVMTPRGHSSLMLSEGPIPDGNIGDAYKNRNNKSSQPV